MHHSAVRVKWVILWPSSELHCRQQYPAQSQPVCFLTSNASTHKSPALWLPSSQMPWKSVMILSSKKWNKNLKNFRPQPMKLKSYKYLVIVSISIPTPSFSITVTLYVELLQVILLRIPTAHSFSGSRLKSSDKISRQLFISWDIESPFVTLTFDGLSKTSGKIGDALICTWIKTLAAVTFIGQISKSP